MCRQDTKAVYKTALTGALKIQRRQFPCYGPVECETAKLLFRWCTLGRWTGYIQSMQIVTEDDHGHFLYYKESLWMYRKPIYIRRKRHGKILPVMLTVILCIGLQCCILCFAVFCYMQSHYQWMADLWLHAECHNGRRGSLNGCSVVG